MRFLLPAVIVLTIDQLSKQYLWHLGRTFELIEGMLRITLVRNSGAAFGLFQDGRWFLLTASVVASLFIIFVATRLSEAERSKALYLGLILGGALGNLVDRVYPGHVIDFIEMGIAGYKWPVYNIADSAVTIGGVLLIITFSRSRDKATETESASETGPPDVNERTSREPAV